MKQLTHFFSSFSGRRLSGNVGILRLHVWLFSFIPLEMALIMSVSLSRSGKKKKKTEAIAGSSCKSEACLASRNYVAGGLKVSIPVNTPKGRERPISEMTSQERVLSAAVSSSLHKIWLYQLY
jgi:hypothetical protein